MVTVILRCADWKTLKGCRFRFTASEMVDIVYDTYFKNSRQLGSKDRSFITRINHTFVCLTATALHHCLSAWCMGVFKQPPEFGGALTRSKSSAFDRSSRHFAH